MIFFAHSVILLNRHAGGVGAAATSSAAPGGTQATSTAKGTRTAQHAGQSAEDTQ